MEIDSPEDNIGATEEGIGSSDIGKFSYESTLAGRGFDDFCMTDSSFDIGNMKAGAARKRGGRRTQNRNAPLIGRTCPINRTAMPRPPGCAQSSQNLSQFQNLQSMDRFQMDYQMDSHESRTKNKILNKATSPDFMQLLNSGSIYGSFEGWFLD